MYWGTVGYSTFCKGVFCLTPPKRPGSVRVEDPAVCLLTEIFDSSDSIAGAARSSSSTGSRALLRQVAMASRPEHEGLDQILREEEESQFSGSPARDAPMTWQDSNVATRLRRESMFSKLTEAQMGEAKRALCIASQEPWENSRIRRWPEVFEEQARAGRGMARAAPVSGPDQSRAVVPHHAWN